MPSNICESIPATYMISGIEPVFCDISETDFQMDKAAAEKIIDSCPISILHYNHTYGYISREDNDFLKMIKRKRPSVFVVDDRCLCFPELSAGDDPADMILYSTGEVKCVDIGWGGYALIKDEVEYREFERPYSPDNLKLFQKHIKECHANGAPISDRIAASMWLELCTGNDDPDYFEKVMNKAEEVKKHKETINNIYKTIPGSLPAGYCDWRYQVLLENAGECIKAIFEKGLFCSNHYKSLGNGYFSDVATPINDRLEKHIINLFNDHRFSAEQAEAVAEILSDKAIAKKRI